jgi:hypothetical protein
MLQGQNFPILTPKKLYFGEGNGWETAKRWCSGVRSTLKPHPISGASQIWIGAESTTAACEGYTKPNKSSAQRHLMHSVRRMVIYGNQNGSTQDIPMRTGTERMRQGHYNGTATCTLSGVVLMAAASTVHWE